MAPKLACREKDVEASALNCRLIWGLRSRNLTGHLACITCSTNSSRNNPKKQSHESLSETGQKETVGEPVLSQWRDLKANRFVD